MADYSFAAQNGPGSGRRGPASPSSFRLDAERAWAELRKEAYFPVREEPLHLPGGRLVPGHRALVNDLNEEVLSVVSGGVPRRRQVPANGEPPADDAPANRSSGYQLITNKQAVEAGREVFAMVFSKAAAKDLRPISVTMPNRRTFMHADFSADSLDALLVLDDAWKPFLRVTNSYNRTHTLRITVGVHCLVCANGMIGEDGIDIRNPHQHPIDAWVEDLKRKDKTKYGVPRFDPRPVHERLNRLTEVEVPRSQMLAGVADTLEINPPAHLNRPDLEKHLRRTRAESQRGNRGPASIAPSVRHWANIGQHLIRLVDKYRESQGETAYAMLGASTEYASRTKAPGMHAGRFAVLQRRCGKVAETLGRPDSSFRVSDKGKAAANRMTAAVEFADLWSLS